jgi:hypothetical protein
MTRFYDAGALARRDALSRRLFDAFLGSLDPFAVSPDDFWRFYRLVS